MLILPFAVTPPHHSVAAVATQSRAWFGKKKPPTPPIHPEADKVYDAAPAPRGPYAAPPAITSPADQASDPLLGRCAADCSSCRANVLPKVSPNERGESSRSTTP